MADVLIDDSEEGGEDLAIWRERFSTNRVFKTPFRDPQDNFWVYMQQFAAPPICEDNDVIRSHGTMGWTWMYAAEIEEEKNILTAFYKAVYLQPRKGTENEPVCLAPVLTRPYFNWFMDVDIKQSSPITIEFVRDVCSIIATTLACFFSDLLKQPNQPGTIEWSEEDGCSLVAGEGPGRLRIVIATSGFKHGINKDGREEYGIGLHPTSLGRLLITEEQAMVVRVAIICKCEQRFGIRNKENGCNIWEEVFDPAVYRGQGGTRIIGSSKVQACDLCQGRNPVLSIKEEDKLLKNFEKKIAKNVGGFRVDVSKPLGNCSKCFGRKKYFQRRAYEGKIILNHLGQRDEELEWLLDDPLQLLLATSLRLRVEGGVETYWKPPPGFSISQNAEGKVWKQVKYTAPKDSRVEAKSKQRYPPDAPETQAVLNYARQIDPMYSEILPDYLVRLGNKMYVLEVRNSSNWKYCLKCSREHGNRICFEVTTTHVRQTSHSDNPDCRQAGCPQIRISEDLSRALFAQSNNFLPKIPQSSEYPIPGRGAEKKTQTDLMLRVYLQALRNQHQPGEERVRYLKKEKDRLVAIKKKDVPVWAPEPEVSDREVYHDILTRKEKKRKRKDNQDDEDPFLPVRDDSGIVWGSAS